MHPTTALQRLASVSLAAALLASVSGPALALDGDAFVAKVNETYALYGGKVEFDSIVTEDDTITVVGAKFSSAGAPGIEVGDIEFGGVTETGDGGYEAETVTVPDVDYTADDMRITIEGMALYGLVVPAKAAAGSLDSLMFYDSFEAGPMAVSHKGVQVFGVESMEGEASRRDGDSGLDTTMTGSGISVDLTQIDDPKSRDMLQKLGYSKLSGSLKLDAGWDIGTGRMELREYSFAFDDVGKINMMFDISGYTPEFMVAMQEASAAAAANPDPAAAKQAMNMAMLGMAQQLTFNSAAVRFEDDSVTGRALKVAGEQQGVSGDQMADALKGMLPLMLGQLNMPALQQQISAAAALFLDNPKSLTITAKPPAPVAVPMIMGASANPQQIVDLLNVQVTAND